MSKILKLECFNDDVEQYFKMYRNLANEAVPGSGDIIFERPTRRYWVAEIIGTCQKYKFQRKFLKFNKDYSESNSKGTRGVFAYYILDENKIYQVSEPTGWSKTEKYFCLVKDGKLIKLDESQVIEWLKNICK